MGAYPCCINQIIVISASRREKSIVERFKVNESKLYLTFSSYVCSQVSCNITTQLHKVPMSVFVHAYRYLQNGNAVYESDVIQAMNCFYKDVGMFLVNNQTNCITEVITDCPGLPVEECCYNPVSVLNELKAIVQEKEKERMYERISGYRYPLIFDLCLNANDLLDKIEAYSVASILLGAIGAKKKIQVRW